MEANEIAKGGDVWGLKRLVFVAAAVSFHQYFHFRYRHYPLVWISSKQSSRDVLALNSGHKYLCLSRKLDCQQLMDCTGLGSNILNLHQLPLLVRYRLILLMILQMVGSGWLLQIPPNSLSCGLCCWFCKCFWDDKEPLEILGFWWPCWLCCACMNGCCCRWNCGGWSIQEE